MKRLPFVALATLVACNASCAVSPTPPALHAHRIAQADLPRVIASAGKFAGAMQWEDRNGRNLALWACQFDSSDEGRGATLRVGRLSTHPDGTILGLARRGRDVPMSA